MSLKNTILAAIIAAVPALADLTPDYKLNTYWGQSGVGDTLAQYCASSSIDYVTLGFVNNSPEHGGGYPGTNFAAHCAADVYVKDGRDTKLLSGCSFIKEDIRTCQLLGKKVLLSIGGDYTDANNYSISTVSKGVEFANFMFEAFGPYVKGSTVPRPFDLSVTEHTVLDGFDFDIETKFANQDPYIAMIAQLRSRITTAGADIILTAAPQCPMDGQFFDMKNILINARFDKIWIQFYNNAGCDAINGGFNYKDWETFILGTVNAAAELYIGLPASPSAVNAGGYISPKAAKNLICEYKSYPHFGGAMLWDAHYGVENVNNGKTYYESVAEALKCGGCPGDVCAPTPPITTSSTSSSSITTLPSTSTLTTITATISTSSPVTSTSASSSITLTLTPSSSTSTLTSSSATSTTTSSSVASTAASTSSSVTSTSTSSSVTSTSAPTTSSSTSISISIPVTSSSMILTSISSSVTLTSTSSSATPAPTSTWSSSSTTSTSTSVSTSSSALSSTITSECTDEPTSSSYIISPTHSLTVTSPSSYSSSAAPYYSYSTLAPTYTVDTSSSSSAISPSESTTYTDDISSTSSVGVDTASPTASYPIVSSGSTTISYTTITVVTTKVYTVTSCAPTVTNCAASGVVVTETIPLYTTVCSVTETETANATPTYQAGPPSYPIGGESSATYSFEASSYLVGSESSETYPVEATGYSEGSPGPSSYPEAPTYPVGAVTSAVIVKVYPTVGTNSTLISGYSHGYPTTTKGSGPSTTGYPGSGYPTVPVATAGAGKTVTFGLGGLILAAFLAL